MKKVMIKAMLFGFVVAGFIVTSNVDADAWSNKVKIVKLQAGGNLSYVYTDRTLPTGGTIGRIFTSTEGYSVMMAQILTAIASDKEMYLNFNDNGYIVQAQIVK